MYLLEHLCYYNYTRNTHFNNAKIESD